MASFIVAFWLGRSSLITFSDIYLAHNVFSFFPLPSSCWLWQLKVYQIVATTFSAFVCTYFSAVVLWFLLIYADLFSVFRHKVLFVFQRKCITGLVYWFCFHFCSYFWANNSAKQLKSIISFTKAVVQRGVCVIFCSRSRNSCRELVKNFN